MSNRDLVWVKEVLHKECFTCAIGKGEQLFTSRERGVKPLLALLEEPGSLTGFAAADKVVGKAAAFLYCLLGVTAVYADVMSQPAYEVFQKAGIEAAYGELTDAIRNRKGDGFCPMEQAVYAIENATEAKQAILVRLAELQSSQRS